MLITLIAKLFPGLLAFVRANNKEPRTHREGDDYLTIYTDNGPKSFH